MNNTEVDGGVPVRLLTSKFKCDSPAGSLVSRGLVSQPFGECREVGETPQTQISPTDPRDVPRRVAIERHTAITSKRHDGGLLVMSRDKDNIEVRSDSFTGGSKVPRRITRSMHTSNVRENIFFCVIS